MESFFIPSVPRTFLLPMLDTYGLGQDEAADPTPPGSHWLFRPPPYVLKADLRSETVTVRNPAWWRSAQMTGYTISDRTGKHVYEFPQGCRIPPRKSITLHCCPGKMSPDELDALPRDDLLWKNQDGSRRRKEVLNDDGDSVKLSDADDRDIALLDIPAEEDGLVAGQDLMKLPGVKRVQVLALRKLVLMLCYVRLACIATAASRATQNAEVFLLFAGCTHGFDVLGRWASSQPGVPMDDFGVVLATLGDRLYALVLLGSLIFLNHTWSHARLFAGILALDNAVNWLQLAAASVSRSSRSLAGGIFTGGRSAAPDFATHLMLRHPWVLTLISVGNEAFLLGSYAVAASVAGTRMPFMYRCLAIARTFVFSWIVTPIALVFSKCARLLEGNDDVSEVMEALSTDSYSDAVDMHSVSAAATDDMSSDDMMVDGGDKIVDELERIVETYHWHAVGWKTLWTAMVICCVLRQLLSCAQALISMSKLSSGVIADAAGHEMNRSQSRGRSYSRANGDERIGVSRARSRSRVRRY